MNLLEKIKQDQIQSRKNKEIAKVSLLTTLYSEAVMVGKNKNCETTDDEVILVIKKFIKNNDEFKNIIDINSDNYFRLQIENKILESYLPKQLTSEEICIILKNNEFENIGQCMKFFKENYLGQYDSKVLKNCFHENNF